MLNLKKNQDPSEDVKTMNGKKNVQIKVVTKNQATS